MSKEVIFLTLIALPLLVVGQITDVKMSDNLTLNKVYLGLDSKTGVDASSLKKENSVSLQTGVLLSYSIDSNFSISSHGVIKMEGNKYIEDYNAFELVYNGFSCFSMHIGLMATPTTELRPNPTTWQSQTETNAQSNIIGGRPGIKVKYTVDTDLKITYGFYNHNGVRANHLKVNYKVVNIAGYNEGDKFFLAVEYNTDKINSIFTYGLNHHYSNSVFVNLKKGYSPMAELEYLMITEKINYVNVGVRKYFSSNDKRFKGFLSISYTPIRNNQITGRFAIHI